MTENLHRTLRGTSRRHALEQQYYYEVFHEIGSLIKRRKRRNDWHILKEMRKSTKYHELYAEKEPLVSVIIPTLNRAKLIAQRTLPSVISQDYQNWEVIIIGDHTSPENCDVLRKLTSPKIHFHNLKIKGHYPHLPGPRWHVAGIKPINFGLRICRGRWIAHLDDDDEFTSNHISSLLSVVLSKKVEWAHGQVLFVDDKNGTQHLIESDPPALGHISRISSLYHVCLKRFRYNMECWKYLYPGDWDLWERFLEMGVTHAHLSQIVGIHHGEPDRLENIYDQSKSIRISIPTDNTRANLIKLEKDLGDYYTHAVEHVLANNAERDQQIAIQDQQIAIQDQQLTDLTRQKSHLEKILTDQENVLATILSSKSWRITNPLRLLFGAFRKCRIRIKSAVIITLKKCIHGLPASANVKFFLKKFFFNTIGFMLRDTEEYNNYLRLCEKYDKLRAAREIVRRLEYKPLISIIIPVYNTPATFLRAAIDSVLNQVYQNWQLCIVDDASSDPYVREILLEYTAKEPRIHTINRDSNGGISCATNDALKIAKGEFIGLLDHDDKIHPFALMKVVELLQDNQELDMIYTDEDKINEEDRYFGPYFKPDWSPEYLLSMMYTCHLGIYRTSIVKEIGGFRPEYDGAQDYDMVLRFVTRTKKIGHVPQVLYHWRAWKSSTAYSLNAKSYAEVAARKALQNYIAANGWPGKVMPGPYPGHHRVHLDIKGTPLVSIVIPTANIGFPGTKDVQRHVDECVKSILTMTDYKNIEIIIVHNGNLESRQVDYFDSSGVRLLNYDRVKFNLAEKINIGCAIAKGEHLIILNDDIRVRNREWIIALLQFSQLPDVGAVGAKLYFPNGTLQHVGIVLLNAIPGHPYYMAPKDTDGYGLCVKVPKNYLAVTGACQMTRREVFENLGGYCEEFPLNYNDVDYCLRAYEKGLRSIYTPYAELFHLEGVSKESGRTVKPGELEFFLSRWQNKFSNDPYYNPNLPMNTPYGWSLT